MSGFLTALASKRIRILFIQLLITADCFHHFGLLLEYHLTTLNKHMSKREEMTVVKFLASMQMQWKPCVVLPEGAREDQCSRDKGPTYTPRYPVTRWLTQRAPSQLVRGIGESQPPAEHYRCLQERAVQSAGTPVKLNPCLG
jgi:hypothetical protein